jgi:hypothetical protein
MNNNQRNKQQAQQRHSAPACGSSGTWAQQQHLVPFAIGPKGASENRTGRRVAMPEELGRRVAVVTLSGNNLTTSYKINALRQPWLRLQRPPTSRGPPTQTVTTRTKTAAPTLSQWTTPHGPSTALPRHIHMHANQIRRAR